ncbi:MAG: hypothetical protein Q8S02_15165 [Hydrogenophaga sp.]|nr:hypothetical protein [Hydrogenophaga sp.]
MIRFTEARTFTRKPLLAALTAITLGLSACGGGSDGGDTASTGAQPTSSILQGRWTSTGIDPAYTAIGVPGNRNATPPVIDTLWGLAQDGSTLYKLQANGADGAAATVTGQRYTLGSAAVAAVTPGSYSVSSTAGAQLTLQSALGASATFTRNDAMSAALGADQANGRWRAALGSIEVSWTVQSAGTANNISGTSTSGCTYSGTSTVVASQSIYQVSFDENCAGTTQRFSGIATLSGDDSRLTVVATNADESRGVALLMARQP